MKLILSQNSITLSINETSPIKQEIIDTLESFSKSFWVNNTFVNLATKAETQNRKAFLLSMYKKCSYYSKKHDAQFLKRLLESHLKPLKVLITQEKTSPIKVSQIHLKVINDRLQMSFGSGEKFLFWYCVNYFKPFSLQCDIINRIITFQEVDVAFTDTIMDFLKLKTIIKHHVQFCYKKNEIYRFLNASDASIDSLEMCYRVLQSHKGESFQMVRRKYLQFAKMYHPDRQIDLLPQEQEQATTKFLKIQQAYEEIKKYEKF